MATVVHQPVSSMWRLLMHDPISGRGLSTAETCIDLSSHWVLPKSCELIDSTIGDLLTSLKKGPYYKTKTSIPWVLAKQAELPHLLSEPA